MGTILSALEVKRKLPQTFVDNLYESFSPMTVDKILSGMAGERITTLRVNNIKYDIQSLMRELKEQNIKFDRVLWYSEALVIKNVKEKELQKLPVYAEGKIYLQSLPSMIPPLALNPESKDNVLDLTAAPGGKTTQMAMMMKNQGNILANEVDKIRWERLKYNVEQQGAAIVQVNQGYGEKIGQAYLEQFDKVLLDAPCSGEGRFIATEPQTYRSWSERKITELVKLQKKLLRSAYHALKIGGTMVYSTCTLNKQENEEIVEWALEEIPLQLLEINLEIKDAIPGLTENTKKAMRILPSKTMEGFFVAKFKKIK